MAYVLPAIIEGDLPIEFVETTVPTDGFILGDWPFPYIYNDPPADLTIGVDPLIGFNIPQRYECRYTNDKGIDVVIRGPENDIRSVLDVLKTYPPNKISSLKCTD